MPTLKSARARPSASVITAAALTPESEPGAKIRPLFSAIRNITGSPITGASFSSLSETSRGADNIVPIRLLWLLPDSIFNVCLGVVSRLTVITALAVLPHWSLPEAVIVFGPSTNGTDSTVKLRFDIPPSIPLTNTLP